MNKYSKILIALFITGSLFTSCDLDRMPESSIVFGQSMEYMEDAQSWDNGLFSFFRSRQYGIFTMYQDVQADQLNASAGFGNRFGMAHTWESFNAGDRDMRSIWFAYYQALANVNHIIATNRSLVERERYVVTNLATQVLNDEATARNRALLDQFLGNAHLARAFYYNELALRWSPAFDPATAAATLSVPIVTEFDITYRPSRATLQEVYNLILSDIARARTLLAHVEGAQNAVRFNRDVVTALEARVRLYMQDWGGAFTAANSLITSGTYPLVNTVAAMEAMWVNDTSTEIIMQAQVGNVATQQPRIQEPHLLGTTTWETTNNSRFLGLVAATGRFNPDWLPSQWVVDMFDADDIRRPVYFCNTRTVEVGGTQFTGLYLITKFRGNPAIPGSATSNVQAPMIFRIAEMYLIAAEAAFRLGNEANALTALNALRTSRGLPAVSATGPALLQEIKDERFRELAFEGFRLFDLKRWGLGFERRNPQNPAVLSTGANFFTKSVPAGHHQFVWGIPSNDVMVNPNLVQNQGW